MNADEYGDSFAVTVTLVDGAWHVRSFDDEFSSLKNSIRQVRTLRSEGPAFAMLCVDEDYFILIRPTPEGSRVLLSDATAAIEDDIAAAALEEINAEIPDLDPDELDEVDPWAEGDFDILADLGLSEEAMGVICDDEEMWPSEQLIRIAEDLNFLEEFADAADLDID
ncbi:hypothetical protein COCCU_01280 [Corynebacterium occultum]|uniref:tRNA adenosine deaminase-associated protein n=1 Tax=Corynebacterium occultum TaxID=2675219 RepID=A0A6B8W8C5_9CORY|nr:tRNA adenosine deaminase-associated protein [Corynebacterium occultum]QGU06220.1 hypothetical protein COCCU_01280 [Corynebacterium occultum]